MEKRDRQAHPVEMVTMVFQDLLARLVLQGPLVSAGSLLLSMMEKELDSALDQWA